MLICYIIGEGKSNCKIALYHIHTSHHNLSIKTYKIYNYTIPRYRRLRRKAVQRKEEAILAAIKIQKVTRGFLSKKFIIALKEEKEERRLVLYADKEEALQKARNSKYAILMRKVLRGCMPLRFAFGEIRHTLCGWSPSL